jgi:hypothetical protein
MDWQTGPCGIAGTTRPGDDHPHHWEILLCAEISDAIRAASDSGKRLARKHVYPMHAVLTGCLLLGCGAEAIKSRSDLDLFQASLRQVCNELCLRQSTSDSTGPQIDVAARVFGEFHFEGNIS